MSEGSVVILNTKLDILIDDFKAFKKYTVAFVVMMAIPLAVFLVNSVTDNNREIAVMHERIETGFEKAIGQRYYLKEDIIKEIKDKNE